MKNLNKEITVNTEKVKIKKYIIAIVLVNVIGIILSLLYGRFGGSGGNTTEVVFIGISITGMLSIVAVIISGIFCFNRFLRNIYWIIPILVINYYEITLIKLDIFFANLF